MATNKRHFALGLCILLLAVACAKPLPPNRVSYVGRWEAPNMLLQISDDSQLHYEKQNGNASTKIDMPIREFNGNDFTVGFGPIATTFVVSQPPEQKDGKWRMVVDGVELTKMQ